MYVLTEIEDYRSSSIGALEGSIAAIPLNGGTIIVWNWETQQRLHVIDDTAQELSAVSGLRSHLSGMPLSLSGSRLIHISS